MKMYPFLVPKTTKNSSSVWSLELVSSSLQIMDVSTHVAVSLIQYSSEDPLRVKDLMIR